MSSECPDWWSDRGSKMTLRSVDRTGATVKIAGPMAKLEVLPDPNQEGCWLFRWKIMRTFDSYDAGERHGVTSNVLRAAFEIGEYLSDNVSGFSAEIMQAFGADAAAWMIFVRTGNYLCIPGPLSSTIEPHPAETFHWISVEIGEEMRQAVRHILELRPDGRSKSNLSQR